jgi:rod shape determining protein RodA
MVDFNRRTLRDVDWITLLAPISLTLFGCLGIYSAAPNAEHWKKQLVFLVAGVVLAGIIAVFDYRVVLGALAPVFYGLTLLLLVLVFTPLGATINENRAWLRVGGFSLQPSEFAKLATIIMLARFLRVPRHGNLPLKDILIMAAIVLPPVVLIFLEKDVGTMLTFGAIFATFCLLGGVRKLYIGIAIVVLMAGLVGLVYPNLKPYQRARVDAVFYPEEVDPRGYGYQTVQTKITVGSGGLFGKGIAEGTQGRLGFLPNSHSDFVASIIAEEMGFAGILLMMGMYLLLLTRLVWIARGARDRGGALMVMGVVALLTFHIACNLGMVVGSLPIMGLPLPLMSAGGTSVLAVFMGIGLALSVRLRRFVN